jgi:cell division protein FtsZ
MVPEMQEIDDFFDKLDPKIEVIWGISTDNSIGGDAKVTILATGMEEVDSNENEVKDDAYYESLIPLLYRPITKPVPESAPEPNFVVEPAPEPEPSIVMEEPKPQFKQTAFERFTQWMKSIVQETDE